MQFSNIDPQLADSLHNIRNLYVCDYLQDLRLQCSLSLDNNRLVMRRFLREKYNRHTFVSGANRLQYGPSSPRAFECVRYGMQSTSVTRPLNAYFYPDCSELG